MSPEDANITNPYEAQWLILRLTLKMAEEVNPSVAHVLRIMDDVEVRVAKKFKESNN